jgi:thiamine-phosphate pyrophosphorylase
VKVKLDEIRLYLITDDRRSGGRPVEEVVSAAVMGGVRLAQYRPDMLPDEEFLSNARALRRIAARAGCALLINDRADIALLSGADGVHLGRGDISIPDARELLGPGRIIGYSAHEPDEAAAAQAAGADFITYSPIFPTTSNSKPREPVGIGKLREMMEKMKIRIPVFPLGGIGLEQAGLLVAAGIRRAAVVAAISGAPDMEQAARSLISAMG